MWPLKLSDIVNYLELNRQFDIKEKELIFNGICTDSRKLKQDHFFIAIKGDRFDGHSFLKTCFEQGLNLALVEKNSHYLNELTAEQRNKCIEVNDVLESLRTFAKNMRKKFPFPVIGVGGSNGKTTTKEMLAAMLSGSSYKITKTEKSENGYLGMAISLCQEMHNTKNEINALVLEIGIDEIGAMEKHVQLGSPDVTLLTALGPEHLERLQDWETAAKEELFLFDTPNTKRIWQLEDEKIAAEFNSVLDKKKNYDISKDVLLIKKDSQFYQSNILEKLKQQVAFVVLWEINKITAEKSFVTFEIFNKSDKVFLDCNLNFEIPLPGAHNANNFALAFATCILLLRTPQQIKQGWEQFVAPPMRSRIVNLKDNNVLLDDCYNSSPMSLEAALNVLESQEWQGKKKLIILGDMLDLGNQSKYWHESFFQVLNNLQNAHLCLYGSAMYDCFKLLKETEEKLLTENNTRIFWMPPEKEPSEFLSFLDVSLNDFVILVKGSRGMKLDRLVKFIQEKYC